MRWQQQHRNARGTHPQVLVRRWNAADEILEPLADEDEVRRYAPCAGRIVQGGLQVHHTVRRIQPAPPAAHALPDLPPRHRYPHGWGTCQALCTRSGLLPGPVPGTLHRVGSLRSHAHHPQEGRFVHAVKTFQLDQFLAPYDLASHNRWRQLSCHISAGVLDALQPVCACVAGMPAQAGCRALDACAGAIGV